MKKTHSVNNVLKYLYKLSNTVDIFCFSEEKLFLEASKRGKWLSNEFIVPSNYQRLS